MSPEMVERVAEQIRAAVYAAGDEGPSVAAARYALALAERAAREGWADGANAIDDIGPPGWWKPENACFIEAAVQRAVEGA